MPGYKPELSLMPHHARNTRAGSPSRIMSYSASVEYDDCSPSGHGAQGGTNCTTAGSKGQVETVSVVPMANVTRRRLTFRSLPPRYRRCSSAVVDMQTFVSCYANACQASLCSLLVQPRQPHLGGSCFPQHQPSAGRKHEQLNTHVFQSRLVEFWAPRSLR